MQTHNKNELFTPTKCLDLQGIEAIKKRAYTDYLTGLYNRHTLDLLLQQHDLTQAILVLIDLDYLKEINDTYGHTSGDTAVIGIAKKITAVFNQANHHIFRLGGDEFLVICQNSNHKTAYERAQKLLESCCKPIYCEHAEKEFALGSSIGIAEYQKDVQSFSQALARVDEMVYLAKKNGRNCIEMTLTQTIMELPILTQIEREQLQQLQMKVFKIGYFDMISESEQFYYQLLTEFFGLTIELEAINQKQHAVEYFEKFDALIHAVSISIPEKLKAAFIPFEMSPLILLAHKDGLMYHPEQAVNVPMGMSRLLYEAVNQYVNCSEHFHIYDTLDQAVHAFEKKEIKALLTSSYFFKYTNLKEQAVPVYRQEISNVTIGLAINQLSEIQFLAPIMKKYLAMGGEAEFVKQTKNSTAIRQKVQQFLTREERELLKQKSQVRVFLQKNHGDFSRYNANLQCYTGLVMHVLNYLSHVLEIDFVTSEYAESLNENSPVVESLRNNSADLTFAIFMPHNRENERLFFDDLAISLPFAHTQPVLMTTCNRTKLSLTHVQKIKVGVLENSYVKNYLSDYQIACERLCPYQTIPELVAALQNYEIQAMMVSHDTATELVERYPLRIDFQMPNHVERILCARNEDQAFMQIINKALIFINEDEFKKF